MSTSFTYYSGILTTGKWMSKTDFIYRLKMFRDCTQAEHRDFLNALYKMNFSRVMKDHNGYVRVFK